MSDFLLIIFIIAMKWNEITAIEYQAKVNTELAMYDENMAEVWVASEQLTTRLKQCEKRKRR